MEIDFRESPEADRLSRVLDGLSKLSRAEVLTLLLPDDPAGLIGSVREIHGEAFDIQQMRWGTKDLPWILHIKASRMKSAFQPPA